ncbi:MAG TPA: hypothetical protein VL460_04430 [Caulobacteraceae bacterium]|jgi:hypothetical protein|nr:hypothetical protein [Caulobacteraceae bacterium]
MIDALGPAFEDAPPPAPTPSVAIKAARAKLNPVRRPQSVWPLIGAAALCAGAALALAAAVILGPPNFGPDTTVPPPSTPVR